MNNNTLLISILQEFQNFLAVFPGFYFGIFVNHFARFVYDKGPARFSEGTFQGNVFAIYGAGDVLASLSLSGFNLSLSPAVTTLSMGLYQKIKFMKKIHYYKYSWYRSTPPLL